MKTLVCNAGSSSLKFSLFEAEGELLLAEGGIDWSTTPARLVVRCTGQPEVREELTLQHHADAIARILDALQAGPAAPLQAPGAVHAVGHRVVHGGERYTTAVRITPEVKRAIDAMAELAPLHNPACLDGINAVEQVLPRVPQVAVDVYVHRIRQTVGAMAATLGGVEALGFTAGVGEHAAAIRERVCENLAYLGLALDRTANAVCQPDADIALPASTGRILVIATREDVTIVRETRRLLTSS
jgi:acetate kinase